MSLSKSPRLVAVILSTLTLSLPIIADPSLVLDSLVGKAQVRRAGQNQWTSVAVKDRFINNDVIRVLDSSWASLTWTDNGTTTIMRANSQMLINTYENPTTKIITKHFTLFAGAAFYLVKSALPQGLFGPENTKVFTPTMVIAIRGTSFGVTVEKATGRSTVEVLNGTLLVRNIVQNVSSFLRAGYWTAVEVVTDSIEVHPMIDKNILAMKEWVPPTLVDKEIKEQAKKAEIVRDVKKEEPKNRIIVAPFENGSRYQGVWEIGGALATAVGAKIGKNAPGLDVQVKGDSKSDPLTLGKEGNARIVVRGTIEEFDITQRAKITARADAYSEFNTAVVRLRLQIVDVKGSKVLYDNPFIGEVTRKNTPDATWKSVSKMKFDLENRRFSLSILGEAIRLVVEQASEEALRYVK